MCMWKCTSGRNVSVRNHVRGHIAIEAKVYGKLEEVVLSVPLPGDLSGRMLVEFSAPLRGDDVAMRVRGKDWLGLSLEEFLLLSQSMVPALQMIERERRKAAVPTVDSEWEHIESLSRVVVLELVDNSKTLLYQFSNDQRKWSMPVAEFLRLS